MPETTLLHEAITDNDLHVVKFLINKGVDVNDRRLSGCCCRHGEPPLHHAVWDGNKEIIQYLVEHGADVNFKDTDGGRKATASSCTSQPKFLTCFEYKFVRNQLQ